MFAIVLMLEGKSDFTGVFTCPNLSCGRVFTEITDSNLMTASDEPIEVEPYAEKEYTKTQVDIPEKPSECRYHPGYLSERTGKEQIPDDCIMCKDIVECMLRKMKA